MVQRWPVEYARRFESESSIHGDFHFIIYASFGFDLTSLWFCVGLWDMHDGLSMNPAFIMIIMFYASFDFDLTSLWYCVGLWDMHDGLSMNPAFIMIITVSYTHLTLPTRRTV